MGEVVFYLIEHMFRGEKQAILCTTIKVTGTNGDGLHATVTSNCIIISKLINEGQDMIVTDVLDTSFPKWQTWTYVL